MTATLADLPVPVMVRRFECPFCHRRRSSKAATAEHIARCWMNPAARSCKTCAHYEFYRGGAYCVGTPCNCDPSEELCHAGVDLPDSMPVTGCPLWSAHTDELEASDAG
jgi:hypothetical protein